MRGRPSGSIASSRGRSLYRVDAPSRSCEDELLKFKRGLGTFPIAQSAASYELDAFVFNVRQCANQQAFWSLASVYAAVGFKSFRTPGRWVGRQVEAWRTP